MVEKMKHDSSQNFRQTGRLLIPFAAICLLFTLAFPCVAAADPVVPTVTINTVGSPDLSRGEVFGALKLSLLVGSLVLLPSVLMTVTCFPRIAIVLAISRQALGTAQTPPNQVVLGIALFLTMAIMGPVFTEIFEKGIKPYSDDLISTQEAFQEVYKPLRKFMLPHTREQDLALFIEVTKAEQPESPDNLGATVVIPAFIISELNSAFQIAFLIYLPFLILDMIISSVLTSMSMITLPPTVISLPLKLMLFVVVDGWNLIIGNLIRTYQV